MNNYLSFKQQKIIRNYTDDLFGSSNRITSDLIGINLKEHGYDY